MNIIIMSTQVETVLRLDTDLQANLLRIDGGSPLSHLEQREFTVRALDRTRFVLSTLGRHPSAQSSQGSASEPPPAYQSYQPRPPMYPSTATGSGSHYDIRAGPSHATTGKLNQHCMKTRHCNSVTFANLLLQDRTWEPYLRLSSCGPAPSHILASHLTTL